MQEARAAPFPSAGSAHLRGPSKIPHFFPGATRSPHTHLRAMLPSHASAGLSLPSPAPLRGTPSQSKQSYQLLVRVQVQVFLLPGNLGFCLKSEGPGASQSGLQPSFTLPDSFVVCCYFCCLVTKSCLTLCNPMDYSSPGSSVRGILQARTPE